MQSPGDRLRLRAVRGFALCFLLVVSTYSLVLFAPFGSAGSAAGTNPPKGIHLSYVDDPTSAVITWHTSSAATSRADWGKVSGSPYAYTAAGKDYLSPNGTFLHTVTLTGLIPGARYYYRVGDASMSSRYGEASFRAAPTKGSTDAFSFAAAGDWGDSTTTKNTALGIAARGVNLVLPNGDLYYSNSEYTIRKVLEKFQAFGESAFVQSGMGNHEYAGDKADTPTDTVCAFANLPGNERTYAYTYGNAFFMTVDWGPDPALRNDGVDGSGASCGGAAGTQAIRAWMNAQLTAANLDSRIQWKIVYVHYLCYGISDSWQNTVALCPNGLGVADQLEDILLKQHVDVVLEGHDHKYGRTYPVASGTSVQKGSTYENPGAPVYILAGTGGSPNTGTCRTNDWIASCRAANKTAGFAWFSVTPSSIKYQFVENSLGVIDSFTLNKPVVTDFSVSLDPTSGRIGYDDSLETTVTVRGVSSVPVSMNVSGCPDGTACTLSPASGTPGFQSELTITTDNTTPFGTYPLTVTASNGTLSKTVQFDLAVSTRQVLSYSGGDGGNFSDTEDAYIYSGAPTTNYGGELAMVTDNDCGTFGGVCRSLVKFPDIIGGKPGQIPVGATILGASLTLSVSNPSIGTQEVYRLTEGWSEYTVAWNSFATPGTPTNAGMTSTFIPTTSGLWTLNITSIVQAWTNGALNQGIMISSSSGDAAKYETSESSNRPFLTVSFDPPQGPAPFDFSIALDPSAGTVAPGGSARANATLQLQSGSAENVTLSCGNLPAGLSCSFSPSSGAPTFVSAVTVAASANATTGSYAVWIIGTEDGLVRQTEYALTVATPPAQNTVTLTFRNGDGGAYSGSIDAYIYSGGATTNYGTATNVRVDADCFSSGTVCKGLISFPHFLGPNPGQVPLGSAVLSATIELTITNPGSTQYAWQLAEAWTETGVTWNSLATPGSPQTKASAITFGSPQATIKLNITAVVQAWAAGDINDGILITTQSGDGVDYSTKESTTPPKLTVMFQAPLTSSVASSAESDEHSHIPLVDDSEGDQVPVQGPPPSSMVRWVLIALLAPSWAWWILPAPEHPVSRSRRNRKD